MNVVQSGGRYQIYNDSVETYKNLPAQTYSVGFHPEMGFWLNQVNDLSNREDKVYGNHIERVNKIYNAYNHVNRNFGVILSGNKGIGKSLMARMIAEKGIENGFPVIIVDSAYPGIAKFLSSIQQEAVIIFDEFEKTFAEHDDYDPQVGLLSLFDGMDGGKKLFIITCNEHRDLNEFLLNRPGRFHYHFEILSPTGDEVREYMLDNASSASQEEIEKVVKLASITNITYDILRAIAFDLTLGYSIEDTLKDLNISYDRGTNFDVIIRMSNGMILTAYNYLIDLYCKERYYMRVCSNGNDFACYFNPADITLVDGVLTIQNTDSIGVRCDYDSFEREANSEEEAEKMRDDFNKNAKVESIVFNKVFYPSVQKYFDI